MLTSRFKKRSERARAAAQILCVAICALILAQGLASATRADSFPQPSARGGRAIWMHSDETYESAYAWWFGGCQPPDYGSWAERYEGCQQISAIVLDVTDDCYQGGECLDAYVWANDDGVPGSVLAVEQDVHLGAVPQWPNVGRFFIDFTEPSYVDGVWWVGFWGRWPYGSAAFYIGADQNGPGGGSPKTKIAPGQGYPEGWQDVPEDWGPTAALGIGAEVEEAPSPAESETWGAVKALFRRYVQP